MVRADQFHFGTTRHGTMGLRGTQSYLGFKNCDLRSGNGDLGCGNGDLGSGNGKLGPGNGDGYGADGALLTRGLGPF